MRSISFICRHDSSVKMSLPLAAEFNRRGWRTVLYIVDAPSAQYSKILAVSNTDDQQVNYVPATSSLMRENFFIQSEAVHIVAEGSLVCDLFVEMKKHPYQEYRPLIISGLIGTLGSSETFFYFQRQMADLIYVGGNFDATRLKAVVARFEDALIDGYPATQQGQLDYMNALYQIMESERIKESIRNKELDMWNY